MIHANVSAITEAVCSPSYLTDGHIYYELLHAFGKTLPKNREGRRTLGRNQYTLALCQIRADNIGNGMRLSTSRRSFYDDGRCSLGQKLVDAQLGSRRWKREERSLRS